MTLPLQTRVTQALAEIRPQILADGGEIELVKIEGDTVFIRLSGACETCPMASFTVMMGVESVIRAQAPEITTVELI